MRYFNAMRRSTVLTWIFGMLLIGCNTASVPPEEEYDFSEVDRLVESSKSLYNGQVVVLVAKGGKLIYEKSIGIDKNTAKPIASATKWLSAAVIMSLVDEGKLSPDDSVGRFLPIFSRNGKGAITIRELFSHTAGLGGDSPQHYEYRRTMSLAEAADSIALYTAMEDAAGTTFDYGGAGMQIGGRIAEVVSGKPWQQLFDEKIGAPCGMKATYGAGSNPIIAGGVRTTASDYMKFLEMIRQKGISGGARVLSEQAVHTMLTDQANAAKVKNSPYPDNPFSPYPASPMAYGMGNWLDVIDTQGNVLESSSPGLFGTHPWQDSKHDLVGIIFTQTQPKLSNQASLRIRKAVRDIVGP